MIGLREKVQRFHLAMLNGMDAVNQSWAKSKDKTTKEIKEEKDDIYEAFRKKAELMMEEKRLEKKKLHEMKLEIRSRQREANKIADMIGNLAVNNISRKTINSVINEHKMLINEKYKGYSESIDGLEPAMTFKDKILRKIHNMSTEKETLKAVKKTAEIQKQLKKLEELQDITGKLGEKENDKVINIENKRHQKDEVKTNNAKPVSNNDNKKAETEKTEQIETNTVTEQNNISDTNHNDISDITDDLPVGNKDETDHIMDMINDLPVKDEEFMPHDLTDLDLDMDFNPSEIPESLMATGTDNMEFNEL